MFFSHNMRSLLRRSLKDVVFHSPLARFVAPRWQYNFSPAQLGFLADCVSRTRAVPGPIFEVGCFAGATTIFLNKHMDAEGIEKPYMAFDTFEGFTAEDVAYETTVRAKPGDELVGFTDNKQTWFDTTMRINEIRRVRSIRADVTHYDFTGEPPSFCLLDVDLFLPVKAVLDALYDRLAPGAMIVVDDCAEKQLFDGARHALAEFCSARGLPLRVEFGKLGLIERK